MNTLTAVCTQMNAGGKFRGRDSAYRFSSGLHGLGLTCLVSLSEWSIVTVKRDGNIYQQKFSRGKPTTDVEIIGKADKTGTTIEYKPDYEIFKNGIALDDKSTRKRLMELASLNAGFTIHYNNEKVKQNVTYCFEDGIAGLVNDMVEAKPKLFDNVFHFSGEYTYKLSVMNKDGKIVESDDEDTIFCDIAFIYTDESEQSGKIKVFANNINTYEGGTHLTGFKNIIKAKMNEYALQRKLTKKPVELMYWLDGLYAVVSVKISNPEFESQTKIKLNNSEAQDAVEKVVGDYFDKLFKDKSKQPILDAIAQHAIRVKEAEEAARRAKAIKRTSKAASKQALPGKLADCANADSASYSEVYLVEGQSSAGSAKTGRMPSFQAILPLRGKVLNVEKVTIDKMLKAPSVQTIISALGCGVGKTFDVTKCRYDKILLATDADVDGWAMTVKSKNDLTYFSFNQKGTL